MKNPGPEPIPVSFGEKILPDKIVDLSVLYITGERIEFKFPFDVASSIISDFRTYLNSKNREKVHVSPAVGIEVYTSPDLIFVLDMDQVSTMWVNDVFS